jgi:hypothetical protein
MNMDEETIKRYLENNKLRKLANYAVKGDSLGVLNIGEKALVAFYSIELITSTWSKELADLQNLITEDLNKKLNDPSYAFERSLGTTKDLILLNKIDNYFSALQLLKPTIDKYWKQLDDNIEAAKAKYKNDTVYIISYRVVAKLLLTQTSVTQEELRAALQSKFPWEQQYHNEAKQIAGDAATRNMQKYISQLNESLNEKGV